VSKPLLVSDANIIIDMIDGGLFGRMFQLEFRFGVPDILYTEELKPFYGFLDQSELVPMELSSESVELAWQITHKYSGLSSNDGNAFALAKQEQSSLLTGEKKLRHVCETEGVECHGTLWLVEQMIVAKIIDCDEAENAYDRMREHGSFLPWDKVQVQLRRCRKKQDKRKP